jgi:hypothetical protein
MRNTNASSLVLGKYPYIAPNNNMFFLKIRLRYHLSFQ